MPAWHVFDNELAIDRVIRMWLTEISHPSMDQFFGWVTRLGSPLAFAIGGLASLLIFFWLRRGLQGLILNICLLTSWGLMSGLKLIFSRPRPMGEHLTQAAGYSFPSGHAMASMAFYGFLAYLLWISMPGRRGKWWFGSLILLVFLIGVSRVYLNVHFASDVLAGFLLGGLLVVGFARLYHYLSPGVFRRS